MRKRISFVLVLGLLLILSACRMPWEKDKTPIPETPPQTLDVPTETEEIPPIETATDAPTATLTPTDTEELTPSLPVFTSPMILNPGIFIAMFTPLEGWAVTQDMNYLLKTEEGGVTWLDATPADLPPLPSGYTTFGISPFFLDENTAWFTPHSDSGGVLYHTQDSGLTWASIPLPFDNARYTFLDINHGFALVDLGAGAGSHYVAIYRTYDGGLTWTEVFTHEPGEIKSLREGGSKGGITFLDLCHGWIGGTIPMTDYFYLFISTDGGVTWAEETDIALPGTFSGSFLESRQPIFMTGTIGYLPVRALAPGSDNYLLIYQSSDAGETWVYQNAIPDGREIDFYSQQEGWVVAETGLYFTLDGGATWSASAATGIPAGMFFLNVEFVDQQHGWVLVTPDDYTWDPLMLFHTVDGGASWSQLLP